MTNQYRLIYQQANDTYSLYELISLDDDMSNIVELNRDIPAAVIKQMIHRLLVKEYQLEDKVKAYANPTYPDAK